MSNEESEVDHALVGRIFLSVAPLLRNRLFRSPIELEPLFRTIPGTQTDVLVLFTKGTIGSKSTGEINPRQSFRWTASKRIIEPFDEFTQIVSDLDIVASEQRLERTIESIHAALRQHRGRYLPIGPLNLSKTVHMLVAKETLEPDVRVFFEVIEPYLEMYRASTIHALNDLYRTREDDLADITEKMTPSTGGTIQALIDYITSHPRFGRPKATAWEFEDETWSFQFGSTTQLTQHDELAALLAKPVNQKLIGAGKAVAFELESEHAVAIPFSRLRDEIMFSKTITGGAPEGSIARVARSRALRNGDWVVALQFSSPPHANVVHTLIQYRQYYFDTFRPLLLKHVLQLVYERASHLQGSFTLGSTLDTLPDLWTAVAKLCQEVLPTIFKALEVSGGVSVYRASDHTLETIFTWDEPSAKRRSDVNCQRLSLQKGRRGVAAATFLEPRARYIYCADIDSLAPEEDKAEVSISYIKLRDSTRSEYCSKLFFKATPIGVINFESTRPNGFGDSVQRQIGLFVKAIEHYIREFLAAQDSHWLAITAAAYHNLHELRQQAKAGQWGNHQDRERLLAAISAFDNTLDEGTGQLFELEDHFHDCVDSQLRHVHAAVREQVRAEAESRSTISLTRRGKAKRNPVDRLRLELLKRLTTNMMSNFDIGGKPDSFDAFEVKHSVRPYDGVRFWQQQEGSFPDHWLPLVGFSPLRGGDANDGRAHHGLFLCGAIARSLGGFLWADNRRDPNIGPQSVVEIVVPLYEAQ